MITDRIPQGDREQPGRAGLVQKYPRDKKRPISKTRNKNYIASIANFPKKQKAPVRRSGQGAVWCSEKAFGFQLFSDVCRHFGTGLSALVYPLTQEEVGVLLAALEVWADLSLFDVLNDGVRRNVTKHMADAV